MKGGLKLGATVSTNSGVRVEGDFCFAVGRDDIIMMMGYLDRAKTKVKSVGATFGTGTLNWGWRRRYNTKGQNYNTVYKPVLMGHDKFTYGVSINAEVGKSFLLTTENNKWEDFYNYCMNEFHLPLLMEWMPTLFEECQKEGYISIPWTRYEYASLDREFPIHGKEVKLSEVIVVDTRSLSEETFQAIVSEALAKGIISIGSGKQKPLEFNGFDDYITKYGSSIVKNLEAELNPLSDLKGVVDTALLKKKRMYPQQAAAVNGILALKRAGSRYGLLAEGMGCGKTVQGAAICDAYANKKWLEANPGKTMVDLYHDDTVSYRNVMMAPSHLVEKWKSEILDEIPNARVTIVHDLSELTKLRARGKERKGREWMLISKDYCKLGSSESPIPVNMATKHIVARYCADCFDEQGILVDMSGQKCPDCGGRKAIHRPIENLGKAHGMVCPDCGEILYTPSKKALNGEGEAYEYVLTPKDFASRTKANSKCPNCFAQLWGVDVRPLNCGGEFGSWVENRKPRWYKVSHFKNTAKKGRTTSFVLRGHETDYKGSCYTVGWTESDRVYGARKTAPALYIRKYLKGYFDFCILDECHKYESGGSAQTNAAGALISVSDFTIGMTGTLMNGKADSLFYLMYLLDPRKMRKMGYEYTDCTAFVRKYGAIETVFEAKSSVGSYNASSRGRQLSSPRVKPGISPLIVTDFLLEKSVFLDLSDLSKYLPPLKEQVRLVEMDEEMNKAYSMSMSVLRDSVQSEGHAALTNVLQFGLSYLDKPFDRAPIMSAKFEDNIILKPPSLDYFKDSLTPKEKELVSIVNDELSEGRNCFVYATYTGAEETDVTGRLKSVIERECNLKGRVYVLQSSSPQATEREAFIKKKASEGIKVFITNPKCVETGLDFCFWKDGQWYNYPTLIFYQVSYELSVMWQASRRGYRLCQTEECRNYYLGYENTLQAAALQIMGEKQVAASAVQGKFSADGLAAMANGVDPRVKLAQMLSDGDTSDRKSLENMFDALNSANNSDEDSYGEWSQPLYHEVMGIKETFVPLENEQVSIFDFAVETVDEATLSDVFDTEIVAEEAVEVKAEPDFFDLFFGTAVVTQTRPKTVTAIVTPAPVQAKTGKKGKKTIEGQMSLFGVA